MRALKTVGIGLGFVVVALTAVLLWYRQASQPLHEGTVRVPGLERDVRIERDAYGIPNVIAMSERDAAFGLGYAHAQDRLWQMEMNRRVAAGRVAEILGVAALDTDKFLRTLGIRRTAERIYANLQPEARALLDAYSEGVNASFATRSGPLPPEFLLTRASAPEPWSGADSIGWSLIMAWDLARYGYTMELRRLALAQRFTQAEIGDIYPPYPGESAAPSADYVEMLRLLGVRPSARAVPTMSIAAASPQFAFAHGDDVGSNNWVAAGTRTVSGKPLLANDPHLGLTTPSLWYFAAVSAPGLNAMGATLPGVPGILLGRNDRIAWANTNTGVDQQDLYLERVNPDDAGEYATPDGWARFSERIERIRVRGEADVELTVRETRHGPVLSGLAAVDKVFGYRTLVLALRWSALEPEDHTFSAVRALNKARTIDEAEQALTQFQVVTQSILLADVDGGIGLVVAGRIPRRSPDNDLQGVAPAPGWQTRYDWSGYLAPDESVRVLNPPGGVIVTANHKVTPEGYPHHFTHDWFLPYRARRIGQLLGERAKHDVASFKAIQADIRSDAARDLLQLLRDTKPLTVAGREAMERLLQWDGRMDPQRPEPLVFHAWMRELKRRILSDDFGDLAPDFVDGGERTATLLHILGPDKKARDWCDDRTTEQRFETCALLATEALDAAVAELTSASGRDIAGLRWGEAHQAVSEHRPFSAVPLLARLFELRSPYPGDTHTVNVGALSHRAEAPFTTRHAASLRAIYDLAALDRNSLWTHSTGQSGSPFSELYASMRPLWQDVRYLPMRSVAPSEARVLELKPR